MSLQERITALATSVGTDIKALATRVVVASEIRAATSKTTPVDADELGITDSAASWGLKKLTFANLKAWIGGLFVSKSGDTINGNLNFSGTGRRITGDFSNALGSNRVALQTNVANGNTGVYVLPNGTAAASGVTLSNSSDPNNATLLLLQSTSTTLNLASSTTGTGTSLPIIFAITGFERLRIDTSGNVLVTGGGGLGYGVGSGGMVTQATSKSTTVTLNKPCGRITLNGSSLGAGASAIFVLYNNTISDIDCVTVNTGPFVSGSETNYSVEARAIGPGFAYISIKNISAGALAEVLYLNFQVHKSAAS